MNKSIKAVIYERHGNPADVLRVEARPLPEPAADEAVVQMRAAPINPADLNAIEGKYPARPQLPAIPGFEGAGVIVDVGADVTTIKAGALVVLPHNSGTWREALALKANYLLAGPPHVEPVPAPMVMTDPNTPLRVR